MRIYSKFEEIQNYLSISEDFFDLEDLISKYVPSAQEKLVILDKILKFINLFKIFKSIKPLMRSIYKCIQKSLEIKPETIDDYDELLLKTTLFSLLQEFILYENLSQKDNIVLDYLTECLECLDLQPAIINLGLMVKPLYLDSNYVKKIEAFEEIEVSYVLGDKKEIEIKGKIDNWISIQKLDLDNQEIIREHLNQEFDKIISNYNIQKETKQYTRLLNEVNEMLTLKYTLLSLMDSVADDTVPIPIK